MIYAVNKIFLILNINVTHSIPKINRSKTECDPLHAADTMVQTAPYHSSQPQPPQEKLASHINDDLFWRTYSQRHLTPNQGS